MNKDNLERMCRAAGMEPERKISSPEGDIYIADGFSAKPGITYWRFYRRAPATYCEEFPMGAYCTMWWLADNEDRVRHGVPMLFDAFHDSDKGWDMATRKKARVNRAVGEAEGFLKTRERVVG